MIKSIWNKIIHLTLFKIWVRVVHAVSVILPYLGRQAPITTARKHGKCFKIKFQKFNQINWNKKGLNKFHKYYQMVGKGVRILVYRKCKILNLTTI